MANYRCTLWENLKNLNFTFKGSVRKEISESFRKKVFLFVQQFRPILALKLAKGANLSQICFFLNI
jgi:hypothetical protein